VLYAFDTSVTPPAFVFERWVSAPGYALSLLGGNLVLGTSASIEILDVTSQGGPALLASLPIGALSLGSAATSLYVGTPANELVVVDLADPTAPLERGRLVLPGPPVGQAMAGPEILLYAAGAAGLLVVDMANPAAPFLRSELDVGSPANGVAVDGSTAWVAALGGLVTVDVADPDNPRVLAQVPLDVIPFTSYFDPQAALSVSIHGGIAYVGTGGSRFLNAPASMFALPGCRDSSA
jgi:hypothetical protein